MRRVGALVAVLVAGLVGLVAGAAGMARVQDASSSSEESQAARQPVATTAVHDPSSATPPTRELAPGPAVLLAWTPLGLDPGLAAAAAGNAQVSATSIVRGGNLDLVGSHTAGGTVVDAPAPGWAVPLDAIAVDPAAHAEFASGGDRAALAGLQHGQALLGATSAELRRLGPGDTVELAGGLTLTVGGVVADPAIGGRSWPSTSRRDSRPASRPTGTSSPPTTATGPPSSSGCGRRSPRTAPSGSAGRARRRSSATATRSSRRC